MKSNISITHKIDSWKENLPPKLERKIQEDHGITNMEDG